MCKLYGVRMELVWNLYGTPMEQHQSHTGATPEPHRSNAPTAGRVLTGSAGPPPRPIRESQGVCAGFSLSPSDGERAGVRGIEWGRRHPPHPGPLLPRREARKKPPRLARNFLNSTAVPPRPPPAVARLRPSPLPCGSVALAKHLHLFTHLFALLMVIGQV
jgi:hypothetical protein